MRDHALTNQIFRSIQQLDKASDNLRETTSRIVDLKLAALKLGVPSELVALSIPKPQPSKNTENTQDSSSLPPMIKKERLKTGLSKSLADLATPSKLPNLNAPLVAPKAFSLPNISLPSIDGKDPVDPAVLEAIKARRISVKVR